MYARAVAVWPTSISRCSTASWISSTWGVVPRRPSRRPNLGGLVVGPRHRPTSPVATPSTRDGRFDLGQVEVRLALIALDDVGRGGDFAHGASFCRCLSHPTPRQELRISAKLPDQNPRSAQIKNPMQVPSLRNPKQVPPLRNPKQVPSLRNPKQVP